MKIHDLSSNADHMMVVTNSMNYWLHRNRFEHLYIHLDNHQIQVQHFITDLSSNVLQQSQLHFYHRGLI